MSEVELAVVGAGPAGLAAAIAARECGIPVRLIDENRQLGGQYFRQLPRTFWAQRPYGEEFEEGRKLFARVRELDVEVQLGTVVWGIFDQRTLALARGQEVQRLRARACVLATGAYDRPVPFPGWTLPGVVTAGGAQNLMKGYGVLPGRRVLVAGSGPLLLVVAHYLLQGGAEVVALCEAVSLRRMWPYGPRMLAHPKFLRQAYGYWRELRRARVPVLTGHVVRRALGQSSVTGAVVEACDGQWVPISGPERIFDVDAIIIGYGFVPTTELPRLAGCAYRYVADVGGWVPMLNERLESTVSGVFVAGEGTGVAGSAVALEEGRLAGLAAARYLGGISEERFRTLAAPVEARLRRLAGFRSVMDQVYRVGPGLYTLMDDRTVVCRCEEVEAQEIRRVIKDGAHVVNEVKIFTQAGMGRCQGRMCGPTLSAMICAETGCAPDRPGMFTARVPVTPLSLSALCHEPGEPHHEQVAQARG